MPQDLISRVASRYLSAGFIPDKVWREGLADLKRIFMTPVDEPLDVVLQLNDRIRPFFGLFVTRLKNLKLNRYAEELLDMRVDNLSAEFSIISERAEAFHRETQTSRYPRATAFDEVHLTIESHLRTVYKETLPTMGKALKKTLTLKPGSTKELAKRLTKKATPEELDALFEVSRGNFNNRPLNIAHAFYQRVNLEGLANRLIVKEKIERDYTKWFVFLRDSLAANYSEEGLENGSSPKFNEFALGNLKAVVVDTNVSPFTMVSYGKLLLKAKALLDRKGFGKVWRGVLLVNSNQYKQLNDYEKEQYRQLGYLSLDNSAGTYHSGDDTVRITAPPSADLVRVVVHEMGHRYWFKVMESEQRARFNSLVKTNASPKVRDFPSGSSEDGVEKPVAPVSDYGASSIEEAFAEAFTHYVLDNDMNRDQLESFRSVLASIEDRVAARFIEPDTATRVANRYAALTDVTPERVERWKKDLRVLTKIYRSLPTDFSEKTQEELREARTLFFNFRNSFDTWVYKFLLPKLKKEEQPQLHRKVAEVFWSARHEISSLFYTGYGTTDIDVGKLKTERDKNIARYNKAFNAAFKVLDEYLESKGGTVQRHRDETLNVSGMKVLIKGFGRGDEDTERDLEKLLRSLKTYADGISRAGFSTAVKGLNIVIDFDPGRGDGQTNAIYTPAGDFMTFLPLGMAGSLSSLGGTFTHEVGHRFWFREMTNNGRAYWNEVMTGGGFLAEITSKDVDSYIAFIEPLQKAGFFPDTHEIVSLIQRASLTDELKAKFKELTRIPIYSFSGGGYQPEDLRRRLSDLVGDKVLLEEVSDYANSGGPIESFAEVFRLYVIKGPGSLGPGTRHLFESVAKSGGARL